MKSKPEISASVQTVSALHTQPIKGTDKLWLSMEKRKPPVVLLKFKKDRLSLILPIAFIT